MSEAEQDLSGTTIGEYRVLHRIGAGGMGVVYAGEQPVIGKRVAIKTLKAQLSNDAEQVERFLSEARAVNAIGHRGIVDIFSFGALPDGTQYFVMEHLEGRPFNQLLRSYAPIPAAHVAAWLEEIVDALSAAHEAGVIHRDIKPSNLFLVERGARSYVKLLDFGVAKMGAFAPEGADPSHASIVVGTPEYIAPEQAQAFKVSAATDLYACAVVAYELLCGQLPYVADSPVRLMYMHVSERVPHVKHAVADVPEALDQLLFELMAKEPKDRPTAQQVLQRIGAMKLERPRGTGELEAAQFSSPTVMMRSGDEPRPQTPTRIERSAVETVETKQTPVMRSPTPVARTSPLLLAAVALSVGAVVAMGGYLLFAPKHRDVPTPAPPPAIVDEPEPLPPEAGDEPPEPPEATSAPTVPVVHKPPPVITDAQLQQRLQWVRAKLAARDQALGREDPNRHKFMTVAEERVATANTPERRRDALKFLNSLAKDLDAAR